MAWCRETRGRGKNMHVLFPERGAVFAFGEVGDVRDGASLRVRPLRPFHPQLHERELIDLAGN